LQPLDGFHADCHYGTSDEEDYQDIHLLVPEPPPLIVIGLGDGELSRYQVRVLFRSILRPINFFAGESQVQQFLIIVFIILPHNGNIIIFADFAEIV
jgi:hypothetical protein